MIVITGATGRLGGRIVERVLEREPAGNVAVSVRDATRAAELERRGVLVREGDFTDPGSLAKAFEGADQVLIVSAAIRGEEPAVAANRAAIDAAREAGARRILYTSHQAASRTSQFPPQWVHARTEEYLASGDVPFTALRNGFYATTLAWYFGDAVATGRVVAPEDGPVSWTAHDDLAEAAAAALTRSEAALEAGLKGVTPPLTATAALDFEAVAAELGELSGRRIDRVVVGDEDWKRTAVEHGMPPAAADFTLGMFRAARNGEFAVTDPTLERILGRPTTPVREMLRGLATASS